MTSEELLRLKVARPERLNRFSQIEQELLATSQSIKQVNFNRLDVHDVQLLFELYDRYFFASYFGRHWPNQISFRVSRRMTRSAGMTYARRRAPRFEIALSVPLLIENFSIDNGKGYYVNGEICQTRLEATMRVMEHEIIHVLEFSIFNRSSCAQPRFKRLCGNLFGHKDVKHQIPTTSELRQPQQHDLKPGDSVEFNYHGTIYLGSIGRITKRATVYVLSAKGLFTDKMGRRYTKFYVPLNKLTPATSGDQLSSATRPKFV